MQSGVLSPGLSAADDILVAATTAPEKGLHPMPHAQAVVAAIDGNNVGTVGSSDSDINVLSSAQTNSDDTAVSRDNQGTGL